jgi:hypothetical protein
MNLEAELVLDRKERVEITQTAGYAAHDASPSTLA